MRSYFLACLLMPLVVLGQGADVIRPLKRPVLSSPKISGDGKFVAYTQNYGNHYSIKVWNSKTNRTLIFDDGKNGFFTLNSDHFIYQKYDTLITHHLRSNISERILNVTSIKRSETSGGFAVLKKNRKLSIFDKGGRYHTAIDSVKTYRFNKQGTVIIAKTSNLLGNLNRLIWYDTKSGALKTIWIGESGEDVLAENFDESGTKISFLISSAKTNSLWIFEEKSSVTRCLLNNKNLLNQDFKIGSYTPAFTTKGSWILIKLEKAKSYPLVPAEKVKVDVLNYKDNFPKFGDKLDFDGLYTSSSAAVNTKDGKVIMLENQKNRLALEGQTLNDKFTVVCNMSLMSLGKFWKDSANMKSYYVFNYANEKLDFLTKGWIYDIKLSPNEQFIVYYDSSEKMYFSYEVNTKKTRKLSLGIPSLNNENSVVFDNNMSPPVGFAGWGSDGVSMLVYDNYDIWSLCLDNKIKPINITAGAGLKQGVKFRLLSDVSRKDGSRILIGFSPRNKFNGFYRLIQPEKSPVKLSLDPALYYLNGTLVPNGGAGGFLPVKAENVDAWVVERQSASQPPNFFLTKDFSSFQPISETDSASRNHITSELITWKGLDGKELQGILYKPEKFNPNKKWPLIFNFYEMGSHELFNYLDIDFTYNSLNIPWFVNKGYLVFVPDIPPTYAKHSETTNGENAYNSVIAAVLKLSSMPFIDVDRLGLQGHSFGGFETNYLIAHSQVFAAAAEAAGTSNLISSYLGLGGSIGKPEYLLQDYVEKGQGRIGASLWERPDLYFKGMPVLNANKVNTPLLIMHNKNDDSVPWSQGVEQFLALWRNDKRVWMLQYDLGRHSLKSPEAADYTLRLEQFFNHYLKKSLAPKWMTEVESNSIEEVQNEFELDTIGQCGLGCKICENWHSKIKETHDVANKGSGQ